MPIYKTYKQRILEAEKTSTDVYTYDIIPQTVRIQVCHIIRGMIGEYGDGYEQNFSSMLYDYIHQFFLREEGTFSLKTLLQTKRNFHDNPEKEIEFFLLETMDINSFLSVVEYIFKVCSITNWPSGWFKNHQEPEKAIEELNERFQRSSLGYEFINGQIIRIDSEHIHQEIVKPSLALLSSNPFYKGADNEYRTAFEYYKKGEYEQVLSECNKAIESCIIAIIEKNSWDLPGKKTMQPLINECKKRGLFSSLEEEHLNKVTNLIKSVSAQRSQSSSHGQGTQLRDVPETLASYVLHLTATNIIFLIQTESNFNP